MSLLRLFQIAVYSYLLNVLVRASSSGPLIVRCSTTRGDIDIEVVRHWSPLGAQRFIDLVQDKFYTDIAFYRTVDGFLTQFGISSNKALHHWHDSAIPDDPPLHIPIKKYYLSFAGSHVNSRTTQIFIAFENLYFLGKDPWETPFGKKKINCYIFSMHLAIF
jgi:peptidyl-prolyl cis-trans isomerase A (cyclophilin A)